MAERVNIRGVTVWKNWLDKAAQVALVEELRDVARAAPPFSPDTPFGLKMTVRMTSAGQFGWFTDKSGYSYIKQHPSGSPWPPIPASALSIWHAVTGLERAPECCLINHYGEGARMGMHQDRDEADFSWPVVSVSLGDEGQFRVGNTTRGGKTESLWLQSGDVAILGGDARLVFHGVDRIRFGSSTLLPKGGRINLTMRVVT